MELRFELVVYLPTPLIPASLTLVNFARTLIPTPIHFGA